MGGTNAQLPIARQVSLLGRLALPAAGRIVVVDWEWQLREGYGIMNTKLTMVYWDDCFMKLDPIALQAERRILCIRQQRVMLDYDLAALYGVETRALKQAVRRIFDRFPSDFMFELADNEVAVMVSQNVIPGLGKLGGARPMAFTEQGVAMLIYVKEDAVPYRTKRKASSKSIPP